MGGGLEPTEVEDGTITVRHLDDDGTREEIRCHSYEAAIENVRNHQREVTVSKIIDRDDDVVFTTSGMDIDRWEIEWKHAKRRLSVDVEAYDCPYDSVSCFADDLCVRCKMDVVRDRY